MDLDFAGRPRRAPLGSLLLVAGGVAACGGAFVWSEAWSAHAAQALSLATLRSRDNAVSARPAPAKPGDVLREQAALTVARNLQTPWSDLLAALEAAPHADVALLAVESSPARQTVRLTAEARDTAAMLDYLAALQADARLQRVLLVSHQLQAQAPGTPLRFTLQASWGAPSPASPAPLPEVARNDSRPMEVAP